DAKDALTAIVDYAGMQLGDKIIATWTGAAGTPAGGSHTAPEETVTVLGPQEIPLANSVVAFNLNKPVTVSYTVKRGNATPLPSTTRTLAVQSLVLDFSNVPKIVQAANHGDGPELDVAALTGNAILRAMVWPFIALGQRVWMRLSGTNNDNTPYAKTIWNGGNAGTNQGWIDRGYYDSTVLKTEIQALKDGSSFTIEFKAGLSGSLQESDAVTFPVRTYTIKAVEDVKPVITRAEDSEGFEIPDGGTIVETSVTLIGTAAENQKVEVFDGTTSKGQPPADPTTGIWTLTVTDLTVAPHSFTAKALYGSGQTSAAWTLTVTPATAPTITSVKGLPSNKEISNGDTTVETSVILSGIAAKGQKVEVFDGTTSKGQPPADPGTGIWTLTVTDLTVAPHSFTAKALYGSGQTSAAWTLTVTPATAPTITSVKGLPSNQDISNGGTTVETSVILTGAAAKNHKVEVFDGTTSKGQPPADPGTGIWTLTVTDLTVAPHSFTARALYGSGQTSAARSFTVLSPLWIDPSQMNLNGANVSIAGTSLKWEKVGNPPGTSATRQATGGIGPYIYKTSNSLIASVDDDGVVCSEGNGTADITVEDKTGQVKSYKVTCSNVKRYVHIQSSSTISHSQYLQWAREKNATPYASYAQMLGDSIILEIKFIVLNSFSDLLNASTELQSSSRYYVMHQSKGRSPGPGSPGNDNIFESIAILNQ
ncbi:Ig-like domain-containing protein, partial [Pseudomonas sp. B15(2017)]|uniref:Ig-like domain-containing protein n=1 Tax=Pseudomonas sp. B15(2017) TaxID=1981744 RepID=UPI001C44DCBE